jgi:drug/metabolite transporter (DMT)-like permease
MLLTTVLYALFASLFGLSKETLNHCEPFFLIGSRMAFAGLLLLAHQWVYNRKAFHFSPSHLFYLFFLGFLSIYLTNVAEIWAIQHMASSKACLIYSLSPFLSAAVAFVLLRERLTPKKWLGLLVGFIGLIPVFIIQAPSETPMHEFIRISSAECAMLVAVLGSVFGWIILKKLISDYQDSPLMANGIGMSLGGMMALLHSYAAGESWNPLPISNLQPFVQNTLLMCLISNIVCYNLYGYLLKRYSATFMSLAGLITPFFAAFFGWYFLDETITWHYFTAISIFGLGLLLFYQEELRMNKKIDRIENTLSMPQEVME